MAVQNKRGVEGRKMGLEKPNYELKKRRGRGEDRKSVRGQVFDEMSGKIMNGDVELKVAA